MKSLKILKFNNFDVGWKPESPEENHPEDADLQSVCRLPLDSALGTRLWLDVSHLNSNLSKKTCKYLSLICQQSQFNSPLAVESRAL